MASTTARSSGSVTAGTVLRLLTWTCWTLLITLLAHMRRWKDAGDGRADVPLNNYCENCAVPWPNLADYRACPVCNSKTRSAMGQPLTNGEAKQKIKVARFDQFYEEREQRREGLSPEQIGAEEARVLAAKWREIEEAIDGP